MHQRGQKRARERPRIHTHSLKYTSYPQKHTRTRTRTRARAHTHTHPSAPHSDGSTRSQRSVAPLIWVCQWCRCICMCMRVCVYCVVCVCIQKPSRKTAATSFCKQAASPVPVHIGQKIKSLSNFFFFLLIFSFPEKDGEGPSQ